jgi:hypothetical protein
MICTRMPAPCEATTKFSSDSTYFWKNLPSWLGVTTSGKTFLRSTASGIGEALSVVVGVLISL